MHRFSQ